MKWKALVAELANRINQPHVIDIYMRKVFKAGMDKGKEDLLALPLASRLTDAEREFIRSVYSEATQWLKETESFENRNNHLRVAAVCIQNRLVEIFGKEMFNETNRL